jgi:hypothetical protein
MTGMKRSRGSINQGVLRWRNTLFRAEASTATSTSGRQWGPAGRAKQTGMRSALRVAEAEQLVSFEPIEGRSGHGRLRPISLRAAWDPRGRVAFGTTILCDKRALG